MLNSVLHGVLRFRMWDGEITCDPEPEDGAGSSRYWSCMQEGWACQELATACSPACQYMLQSLVSRVFDLRFPPLLAPCCAAAGPTAHLWLGPCCAAACWRTVLGPQPSRQQLGSCHLALCKVRDQTCRTADTEALVLFERGTRSQPQLLYVADMLLLLTRLLLSAARCIPVAKYQP
jgi:hypothetical protein